MASSAPRDRLPSLHTRLGVALGALILLLAIALATVMSDTAEQQVRQLSSANLQSLSTQMSRALAGGMDRFAQAVVTQTDRDTFRDPNAGATAMRRAVDLFKRNNPEFAFVAIVDVATGKVEAASGGILEGGDLHGRPVYERGKEGVFVGDVHPAVRLAELMPKPSNGETLRFLDVAAPISDESGRAFRVFATHVAWQWTDNVRRDIFGPVKETSGVDAFLVDTAGKIVLAETPALKVGTDLRPIAALTGKPATVVAWPDGGEYLTVVTATTPHGQFPGFGWKVVARQPAALAVAAASRLRTAFLIAGLVLGLVAAAAAWLVTGRLTRPVRWLAAAAASPQGIEGTTAMAAREAGAEVSAVQQAFVQLADTARSESEANQQSQRQFAVLAESLPQVVFQTDAEGVVEYINKPWLPPAGPEEPAALRALETLVPAEDEARFGEAWRHSLTTGDDLHVRCRLQTDPAAPPRWFDVDARAIRSETGFATKWIGTIFDVHAVVVHAEEVELVLETERRARRDAERLARMRDEFLATVSHELRSPLSVITGWSDILRRKGSDNPMVVKAADIIRINARLQANLINDLLDITALMAGKLMLNPEPVDLARTASEAVQSQMASAEAKGVTLSCRADAPGIVDGDRRRLVQVLAQLIGNAIKFTENGGSVIVSLSAEAGTATLSVADTGRGIAPDFLPHVFERMRQADSSITRRAGGLGLGLAIVEGLVRLHRGRVTAQSGGVGQGAVFTVALPLAAELPGPTQRVRAPDDADDTVVELQGCRILLVDDEANAREVAQVALSSLGADVRVASSGAEVLQILERERFDVLVSDIGMPDMDGLTLMRKIRSRPDGSSEHLPAVALTAFAMEADRRAGLQAGFQAYVAKPISLRRLSEAISTAMATTSRRPA